MIRRKKDGPEYFALRTGIPDKTVPLLEDEREITKNAKGICKAADAH